jgi:TolB-like protein/DNA-binding winged helix-turn-helix (wHTH) protein/lipoprotein NlpI
MLAPELKYKVRFGRFEADFAESELRKSGIRLRIQGKPLAVLQVLLERPGEIVSRETLRKRLWTEENVFVDFDKALSTAVNKLREALGDSAEEARYIETIPKRGYRFLAHAEEVVPDVETAPEPPVFTAPAQPEPPRAGFSSRRMVLASAAVLVIVLSVVGFWQYRHTKKAEAPAPTVAVLPFTNRSPESKDVYLADGLTDEVITHLGRVPGLKVIGRYSSSQLRTRDSDLRDFASKLGVEYLVEGSVARINDRIRIDAEMVKVSDGFQVWTESYETKIDDVLRVEDNISRSVAAALSAKLFGSGPAFRSPDRQRVNPEAYQAYLQARYFKGRWIVSELNSSLVFLNSSLQLDQNYAPSWALRSSVYLAMGGMGVIGKEQADKHAREDAERAIQLDPTLIDGLVALSYVEMSNWNWRKAEVTLSKAAELEPRSPDVLSARSHLYRMLGRLDECIRTLQTVAVLDPLSPGTFGMLGNRFYYAGRFEEALQAQDRALGLNPQAEFVHLNRAQVRLAQGRVEDARKEVELEPGEVWNLLGRAMVSQKLGHKAEADAALQEMIAEHQDDQAYLVAELYAYRGDVDNAFAWLDRAQSQNDAGLVDLKVDPLLRPLRTDARYSVLLKKLGLPE